jgi:ubiquinone biosynthesis protein
MKQIFIYGFFHGDPHPGNILILPENVICYLDFGIMGRVSSQEQEDFAELAFHVVQKNGKRIAEGILKIVQYEKEPDREALERDLMEVVEEYYHRSLKEIDLGKLLQRIIDIVMKHGLSLKPNLYLMMKAIIAMEGLGHVLDPEFEIIPHVEPFVKQAYLSRFRPGRITQEVMDSGMDLFRLLKDFPGEFRTLIKQVREGKVKIQYEHRGLDPMLSTLDRISNRVAFSIVLASLVIGSSLIILAGIPPKWQGIPIIGLAGFIVAGFMGFWLLVSILRRKGM